MAPSSSSSSSSSPHETRPVADAAVLHSKYPNNNGVEPYDFEKKTGVSCFRAFKFPLQSTLLASSGSLLFGFNLALLNTSMKAINIEFGFCNPEAAFGCSSSTTKVAFINTAIFIGAATGSMTAGRFIALGRRMVFLLSMAIFALGILSSVLANSFSAFLWARLIVGYGVGIISFICPMYIAEMVPKERRGMYGVVHQMMITIGIFLAVLIGLPFSSVPGEDDVVNYSTWTLPFFDKVWWRVMLGLGILPVAMTSYLLSFVYRSDTPNYYVENKQYDDAAALLRIINDRSDVADLLAEIEKGTQEAKQAQLDGLSLARAISQKDYQMVIIVGCLLSAFQQLTGINIFVASSNTLFENAGFKGAAVTGFSIALTGVNVIMTFPAIYLIESLGRKSLLMIGTAGQAVGVIPPAVMYLFMPDSDITSYMAIAGSIIFIIFFSISYGPVLWVYLFEIYPAEIRGAAAGAATAVNWISGIVMVFISSYIGNRITFSIFGVMCVIAFLIALLLMRETKGRSLDDSPYMTKTKTVV